MPTSIAKIPLRRLTGSVDEAVKAALARHQVKTSSGFVINPGILAGPILEAATDLKVAQQIAEDITQHVQRSQTFAGGAGAGSALTSGILVTRDHILCGFFPFPAPVLSVEE